MSVLTAFIQEWMDLDCFLKCGKGAGPVPSEGMFRAWLKPSAAFLAWLCIEEVFLASGWCYWRGAAPRTVAEAAGCVWVYGVRCETCQPRDSAVLCSRQPRGCGGKGHWQGGILLVYSAFIFMEALIGLWSLRNAEGGGKKRTSNFLQDRKIFPAQLLKAYL